MAKTLSGVSWNELVIISDFDGTITEIDTNNLIIDFFGDEGNKRIENRFKQGSQGTKETMKAHFKRFNFTEQEYLEFLQQRVKLRTGFVNFYYKINELGLPFVIVSGGFTNAIQFILDHQGINETEIYANHLKFSPGQIEVDFFHEIEDCDKEYGVCGNCKLIHLNYYREELGKYIIFIGDGLTDRCIAMKADLVFARAKLASFLRENGTSFLPYEDFDDITVQLGLK